MSLLALTGGVGGAKLVAGLAAVLATDRLTVVVNTGDDFEHLGLYISPDLDTVLYTLAGLANPETGWGRANETWSFLSALGELGGEAWFRVGDRDLAIHVERTRRLRAGASLSEVVRELCRALRVQIPIVPMSDQPVRTMVSTPGGELPFQHYFVRERCAPRVSGFRFDGIESARPSPDFCHALADPSLEAVLIGPSNPFVSVDPILALPEIESALRAGPAPVVAVSPIVGGRAVRGPAAKMMAELGLPVTPVAIARHYHQRGLLRGFVFDQLDAACRGEIERLGLEVLVTRTVMESPADRSRLAREVLAFAQRIR